MYLIGLIILFALMIGITQINIFFKKTISFKYRIEHINKTIDKLNDNNKLIKTKKDLINLLNETEFEYQKEIIKKLLYKIDFNLKFKVA